MNTFMYIKEHTPYIVHATLLGIPVLVLFILLVLFELSRVQDIIRDRLALPTHGWYDHRRIHVQLIQPQDACVTETAACAADTTTRFMCNMCN